MKVQIYIDLYSKPPFQQEELNFLQTEKKEIFIGKKKRFPMWNDSCKIYRNQAGELFIIVQYSFWEKPGESFVKFWYVF